MTANHHLFHLFASNEFGPNVFLGGVSAHVGLYGKQQGRTTTNGMEPTIDWKGLKKTVK
jgi:hypothetical protein